MKKIYVGNLPFSATEDEVRQLFAQYGIRDEPHYHQVQATHDRYIQSPAAAAQYGGVDQILQLQMNTIQQMVMDQMQMLSEEVFAKVRQAA